MTQPTPYTRATGFADDERNNTGGRSTVRTAQVDAELDAVGASLNQAIANLGLIQRDDGQLRDGIVSTATLSAEVMKLIALDGGVPRGAWLTATAYAARDIATQSGNTYVCAVAHTSGTFATDLAAGKWILVQLGSGTGASSVVFTPTATIAATNTQAAIEEVDTEVRALVAAETGTAAAYTDDGLALLRSDMADTTSNLKGAALFGFNSLLSYAAGTVGGWLKGILSTTDASKGTRLIGFKPNFIGGVGRLLGLKLEDWCSASDFGVIGGGTVDDTASFVAAFAAARAAGYKAMVLDNRAGYKITDTVAQPYDLELIGNHCMIRCETISPGSGKAAWRLVYDNWTTNVDRWRMRHPLRDVMFRGHATPDDSVFTANLHCLQFESYHQVVSGVTVVGFDKGATFAPSSGVYTGWLTWETKLEDCVFAYCNLGMSADFSAAGGGSGAGVTMRGGGFTHCVNSINMNAVEMTWLDVYSDNVINQHCSGLVTKLGGTEFGFWHVTNSRFEGGIAAGVPWMDLNGRAVFRDCFWVGRSGNEKVMLLGSDASVVVEGGTDRSIGNQIRASGPGSLTVFGVRPISNTEASTWTSGTGGFLNGDAGTGTTDGWAVTSGGGALTNSTDGNYKHAGKAFQVVGASTVIASAPVWLDPSYNQFNVVFRASNANASAVVVTLRQYNITGNQVATATVNIPAGAAGTLLNITGTRYGNACYFTVEVATAALTLAVKIGDLVRTQW